MLVLELALLALDLNGDFSLAPSLFALLVFRFNSELVVLLLVMLSFLDLDGGFSLA